MSREKGRHQNLDEITAGIRHENVDEGLVNQAAARVWERLSELRLSQPATEVKVERIRSCADFQLLVPAYQARTLIDARRVLLEDHLVGCVACRRVLAAARPGDRQAVVRAGPVSDRSEKTGMSRWKVAWALAAVLLVGVGVGILGVGRMFSGGETRGSVQTVAGGLYRVSDAGLEALPAGSLLVEGEEIRTARASSAVLRLADGSSIEMNQRADLWVSHGWRGTSIHLGRGNIIVQAARQRRGKLFVATHDCLVAVKGTVFAVDEGIKGSRVSALQGEVEIRQGQKTRLLHAGEQVSTESSLAQVPVAEQISWSRNSSEYLALLGEFTALHKQLEAIPAPTLPRDSTLVKMVPEGTVFYAAIPNMGETLAQANSLFQSRIEQSEVLQTWWNQQQASGQAQKLQGMIDEIRSFSDYLGNEVVIAVSGGPHSPLLLAEVRKPGFREFLRGQLGLIPSGGRQSPPVFVDDPFSPRFAATGPNTVLIMFRNNLLAVATDSKQLQRVAGLVDHSASSGFVATPFYAAIQDAYGSGTEWLLAADMEQILSHSVRKQEGPEEDSGIFKEENIGLADMRYLIVESQDTGGKTENRATLTFAQDRRGIASWLAPPSPMGTLDFVSPAASFAASFVVKDPRDIVQEVVSIAGKDWSSNLADFESKSGVSVSQDLAASLGGEITFALDGPVLPTPSWKLALEVSDPIRLEAAIEKLVAVFNEQADRKSEQVSLSKESAGGRTYYDLHFASPSPTGTATDINYVFADGYLLAAPNRALLLSSIQNRETGYSLDRSSDFISRLPRDGYVDSSALVYQNIGPMIAPLASQLKMSPALTPAQRESIESLSQNSAPSLICAYGEPQQIVVAYQGSLFGLGLDSLLGIGGAGPFKLLPMIENAERQAHKGS